LSDRLGIGRASLYRALDDFEADGIIHRDGKNIFIKDINTLKKFI
ncbi:MAG: winged helix-turn-helix domain-containing protein, partial [Clostridia bacterium]|nr:winged helix-turn-helix domain-containing protein [Clostridia bacterium]